MTEETNKEQALIKNWDTIKFRLFVENWTETDEEIINYLDHENLKLLILGILSTKLIYTSEIITRLKKLKELMYKKLKEPHSDYVMSNGYKKISN